LPAARTNPIPLHGALDIVAITLLEQPHLGKRWMEAIQRQTHFPLSEIVPVVSVSGVLLRGVIAVVARQFERIASSQ
jgi:hypothetical protein